MGREIVALTCAYVGYTAADTSAFAAQRHNKRLRHRPASRCAARFLFSAARDATALARPRALHAPQPLARSSLAFGSSGFHGQACASEHVSTRVFLRPTAGAAKREAGRTRRTCVRCARGWLSSASALRKQAPRLAPILTQLTCRSLSCGSSPGAARRGVVPLHDDERRVRVRATPASVQYVIEL